MTDPRLLLIETSQQPGIVAVAEGLRLLAVRHLDEARRHARDLAPAAKELLKAVGWQPRQVTAVAVGIGPGSYTGLRVGVMSAKTFAFATGCTLIGVETFAVIASQAPANIGRLAVIEDAQQDKVYIQEFEQGKAVSPLKITPIQEWLQGLSTGVHVCGPGLRKWIGQLPALATTLDASLWCPQPEALLRLALERLKKGEKDEIGKLEPIYLRPSAAEEKWDARPRDKENP